MRSNHAMTSPASNSPTTSAAENPKARIRRHTSELIRLASPIVVSRSGFLLLVMADVVMIGRHSAEQLAYLSIALGLIMPLMITSLGLIMGTLVLSANEYGAGRYLECGVVWRRSLSYAFILGIVCIVIGLKGELLLGWTGQTDEIAAGGGAIMAIIALGMPGHLLFLSSAYFLEGIGRPVPAMLVMVLANVINVFLNWVLIDGISGADPLGAAGAAWATTASRWVMAVGLAVYVWNMRDQEQFGIRRRLDGGFDSWRELRRIGYAIGLSVGVESLAFATLNVFAGWLGKIPLATYGLTLNLMALVFMFAIGVGSATAVRVGIAQGRGDPLDAAIAGWTGLGVSSVLMLLAGAFVYVFVEPVAHLYATEPELLAASFITVAFVVWIFVPDGGQAVMANALRGRKDVWAPSVIQTVSFFVVMVPVGYASAFMLENGVVGLFHGILIGCIVSLLWLCFRFHTLSRRDIEMAQAQCAEVNN